MHEGMPTPEEKKSGNNKETKELDAAGMFNRYAENFFALKDKPSTTYEQQNEFLEKSIRFHDLATAEKDPVKTGEYAAESKKYAEEYKKSRHHKYAAGNYTPTFGAARIFLEIADNMSEKDKEEVRAELHAIDELINKERPTGMTPEVVSRVSEFIKKFQKYTK